MPKMKIIALATLSFLLAPHWAFSECVLGDCKNGNGTYEWANGETYSGSWEGFRQQGFGVWTSKDLQYMGDWKSGQMSGEAVISYSNGDEYVGTVENGHMNGKGTFKYNDGDFYTGDFVMNERTGDGLESIGGDLYVGSFLQGSYHGSGSLTYSDGYRYEGDWLNGKRHGFGSENLPQKYTYIGEFAAGTWNGFGKAILASGDVLEGMWRNGKYAGSAEETYIAEQLILIASKHCSSKGFTAGTSRHRNCVVEKALADARSQHDQRVAKIKADTAVKKATLEAATSVAFDQAESLARQARRLSASIGATTDRSLSVPKLGSDGPTSSGNLSSGRYKTCRYRVAGEIVPMTVGRAELCPATRSIGGQTGYLVR